MDWRQLALDGGGIRPSEAGSFERGLRKRAIDVGRDEWDNLIGTNVTGTFFLTSREDGIGSCLYGRDA